MLETIDNSIIAIERIIGSLARSDITPETIELLKAWAIHSGHSASFVDIMKPTELVRLYKRKETVSKLDSVNTNDVNALTEQLKNLPKPEPFKLNESRVRELARAEIDLYEPKLQRLEVTGPTGVHSVEGIIHCKTDEVLQIVALGHPILLVGPAGCGKTKIGEHTAKGLGLPFYITPVVFDTHELLGFVDGYGKYHTTPFRQAFEHGGVWLADEIDAWDAAALLSANAAIANGFTGFPDSPIPIQGHKDFRIVATANTFGYGANRVYVGRNQLDAASLDRFATLEIDYDLGLEKSLCPNAHWLDRVRSVRQQCETKNIRHVISTRAAIMGAQALAAKIPWKQVEQIYMFKGMSESDRKKIT